LDNIKRSTSKEFGQYIKDIRLAKNMTIREVEKLSDKKISNSYLSQLETGKIQTPSPTMLEIISETYGCSYQALMEKIGYLKKQNIEKLGNSEFFMNEKLTQKEEAELIKYLGFLRNKDKKIIAR